MVEANWLEISLVVDGELAEAVAEVLDRFVLDGVVIESGFRQADDAEAGTPTGPVRVFGYLFLDAHTDDKKQRIEEGLWHLGQIRPIPQPTYRIIENEDWMAAWKKHYMPLSIGRRLMIEPVWMDTPDTERIKIKIDPGMAFGTGTHPSTQLCLEHLEEVVQNGDTVIDVGCGSGILSIAAIKLGAEKALSVDIESPAIKNTESNARANSVLENIVIGLGSVREINEFMFSIQNAPIVVANILAPIIIRLFTEGLGDLVSSKGTLILAGILDRQEESVIQAAQKSGFRHLGSKSSADWVSPIFQKLK